MKIIITITILFCSLNCQSQMLETINFKWDPTPVLHNLEANEANQTAVFIKDERQFEYLYNKDSELEEYYFRHCIVHISDGKAIDNFNKIYIAVNDPTLLVAFKARSIDKNGKIKEMLKGEMKEIDDDGQHYMSLAIDGLEINSELEYYYTKKLNTSFFISEIIHSDFFIKDYELKIISPEKIIVEGRSYNGYPQFTDTLIGRKRFLISKLSNIQPIPNEQYATYEANKMRVDLKIAKNLNKSDGRLFTWADAGNRYYDLCFRLEKDEIKEANKLADILMLKNKSNTEVIRIIENYIKSSFELVEQNNFTSIIDIIKKKYTNKIGLCRLTSGLLKSAGIKFELIITINRFKKKFDPTFDTWNNFDDLLFYFPSLNTFLSPSNYGQRNGLLPAEYIGASGLFIKEVAIGEIVSAVSSVKKIPLPELDINGDSLNVEIKFSPDFSSIEQRTDHYFSRYTATALKAFYFYNSDEKKKEQLLNLLKFGVDDAVVTNEKAQNYNLETDEANKPFIISGNLKYSTLIEKAGNTILFNVGAVIGPQVQLYSEKTRQQPIEIEFLHSYIRRILINVPVGYTAKELNSLNMNITSDDDKPPSMGFISTYSLKDNILEINIVEYYNKIAYPASYFEVFRKVINASADFNKIKIIFEKS